MNGEAGFCWLSPAWEAGKPVRREYQGDSMTDHKALQKNKM